MSFETVYVAIPLTIFLLMIPIIYIFFLKKYIEFLVIVRNEWTRQ